MKILCAIALLVGLAGCGSTCGTNTDEASCTANPACHWNKNENACKS